MAAKKKEKSYYFLPSELKEIRRRLTILAAARATTLENILSMVRYSNSYLHLVLYGIKPNRLTYRILGHISKDANIPLDYLLLKKVAPEALVQMLKL
jgi:hypothetical protein